MLSINDANKIIKTFFEDAKITSCVLYKNKYYYTLKREGIDMDLNNCFRIDRRTKTVEPYSINTIGLENLSVFCALPNLHH